MDLSIFPSSSISFYFVILKCCAYIEKCLGFLNCLDELICLIMMENCLFLVILFAVKSALIVTDIVTSPSFWLVLTWFLSCLILKVGFHSLHQNSLFVSYILRVLRTV